MSPREERLVEVITEWRDNLKRTPSQFEWAIFTIVDADDAALRRSICFPDEETERA